MTAYEWIIVGIAAVFFLAVVPYAFALRRAARNAVESGSRDGSDV